MRMTLDIADDVVAAAKVIAKRRGSSASAVISELARAGLRRPIRSYSRNGVPILTGRSITEPVTLEIVNALRDEEP